MFRSIPPEVFSKKTPRQTRNKPTGEQPRRKAISTKPFCNFIESKLIQDCAPKNPHHPQNTFHQENTSGGLLLYVKRVLKDLSYKKLLFTVVKRNLLTLKK